MFLTISIIVRNSVHDTESYSTKDPTSIGEVVSSYYTVVEVSREIATHY